ncbi:uncharacterized protein LACBIDRAFT_301968 [Laccaria bicolor S238N-H82]|uniref:Predicted protein n=1 Tax=Laccaria bicolor (strain S238N-H82 / ATCC MYA-4686) TaxID=486041 RepID=B0CQ90_LACBS|nr:uncharacterized protein LACBIDRAFT_301968 [Laccaria bicolor S238N-H82]EDR15513.1 predicted protein [Laccaria bicolor S238N-H82]|eukprot:XP_001873721.1 predicted protein [Laccaria bicolor S238N-H82]
MSKTATYPALLGDGQGRYRVHVVGNSGSGKTTTGIKIANILGVPHISLDRLFWQPGWKETPKDEFEEKIRAALGQCERGWVVDGEYTRQGGLVAQAQATDVIWVDPPLLLYFPRIIIRTLLRLFNIGDPCSPGCGETIQSVFFSSDSILWWCLSNHWANRRKNIARMAKIGLVEGTDIERRRMRRIGGWGSELKRWIGEVERLVHGTKQKVL